MHDKPLVINKIQVNPGERKSIQYPLPSLYECTPVSMPIHVIRGKKEGPTLLITAAIHGDEINGVEIVRRLLKKKSLNNIRGTLIAIPVVNVYGFLFQDRYLMDRRDLNRSFPGSKSGSLAARLAYILTSELAPKADYHIDLHSGSLHRSNLPQIRVDEKISDSMDIAMAFNAPVILRASERESSFRQHMQTLGIPTLLYEAGEAHRFDETSIKVGLRGISNVMQAIGMSKPKKGVDHIARSRSSVTKSSYWIRSPFSGIFRSIASLGSRVDKGSEIAVLGSPINTNEYEICAPYSGIVIGLNNLPIVHEGAALFNIACFEKLSTATNNIENLSSMDYIEMHTHLDHY